MRHIGYTLLGAVLVTLFSGAVVAFGWITSTLWSLYQGEYYWVVNQCAATVFVLLGCYIAGRSFMLNVVKYKDNPDEWTPQAGVGPREKCDDYGS